MEINDACDFVSIGIYLAKDASEVLKNLAVGSIHIVEVWNFY